MAQDRNERPRRSVPKGKKLFDGYRGDDNEQRADWSKMDPGRIVQIISLVTSRGGAIRFGYSRDGKTCSIGVYLGDDRDTLYLRPSGDIEEIWDVIESTFGNLPNTGGVSPNSR